MIVETSKGPARFHVHRARRPKATLILGHGAGGTGIAPDLAAVADLLPKSGITVLLHDQPWKVAGKKVAAAPPVLDVGWVESVMKAPIHGPLFTGGRSAGARVACRTAAEVGARAVVALAFPLHPPGKPDRSRADELDIAVPLLVVQGRSDAFGRPGEFPPSLDVVAVPGDHSLKADVEAVAVAVRDFLVGMI